MQGPPSPAESKLIQHTSLSFSSLIEFGVPYIYNNMALPKLTPALKYSRLSLESIPPGWKWALLHPHHRHWHHLFLPIPGRDISTEAPSSHGGGCSMQGSLYPLTLGGWCSSLPWAHHTALHHSQRGLSSSAGFPKPRCIIENLWRRCVFPSPHVGLSHSHPHNRWHHLTARAHDPSFLAAPQVHWLCHMATS